MRRAFAVVVLTVGCFASACSGAAEGGSPKVEPPATNGAGGVPVSTGPPVTFATGASADDVMAALDERFPLSGAERSCVVARLNGDEVLLGRLRDGVAAGSAESDALTAVVGACRQSGSFADQFAASVAASHPGLTGDQQACLRTEFGALAPERLQALVSAAVNPEAGGPAGSVVVDEVLGKCKVR